jgi:pyruvate formate lyase activating enzyme
MKIGGWQRVSLVDYPGKICAILFAQGCNFRCPYCHNPELVLPAAFGACVDEATLFAFLEKRKGIVDAVTVTGGEPTLQSDLAKLIGRVKALGYLVKLDTNGSRPAVLKGLIDGGQLDYVAMDIKGPLERYGEITGVPVVAEDIGKSIDLIVKSGLPHEFRTTLVDGMFSTGDFEKIGRLIRNASRYVLQRFIASKPLDPAFLERTAPPDEMLATLKRSLEGDVEQVVIR